MTPKALPPAIALVDKGPINPDHYKNHPSGIECIEISEHFNSNMGQALQYIWRADSRKGIEDLKKAQWYITREIQRRENYGDKKFV